MGLLDRLFNPVKTAVDLKLRSERIVQLWDDYVTTVAEKEALLKGPFDAGRFRQLVLQAISDISNEEAVDKKLIKDVKVLDRHAAATHLMKLERALNYAENRHEYLYGLLEHLYGILRLELASTDAAELRALLENEKAIVARIRAIPNFNSLFTALINGEKKIAGLSVKERRMYARLSKILKNEVPASITYRWIDEIFDRLAAEVGEAIDGRDLESVDNADFEFVNGSRFVPLVERVIASLRKRKPKPETIAMFVKFFRENFNARD